MCPPVRMVRRWVRESPVMVISCTMGEHVSPLPVKIACHEHLMRAMGPLVGKGSLAGDRPLLADGNDRDAQGRSAVGSADS